MKISVIIPTYRPEEYFYDCLSSLKNQDFSCRDFEIIIVLNGLRHPYENAILNYVNSEMTNVSVNYIYSDVPGVSNARNIGIENATGEYIFFVDDDDLISANYLRELYDYRIKDGIVVSNIKSFNNNTSDLFDDYLSRAYASNRKTDPGNILKLRSFLSMSCGKLISVELIRDSRFDPRVVVGEDSLFMFLLSDRIKKIKLCLNSDALYFRRIRPHSASRKRKSLFIRISIMLKLVIKYTAIYFKSIKNYNFWLYSTRIAGSIITIFKLT